MRRVGEELGNTPAVARASYVSPAVIEQWRDGRTLERFRAGRTRVVSGRDTELLAEEAAFLSLLRSWRIRRARRGLMAGREGPARAGPCATGHDPSGQASPSGYRRREETAHAAFCVPGAVVRRGMEEQHTGKSDDRPVLLFFSNRRSGPARRMSSLVAWIRVTEKKRLRVIEVDADANPSLAEVLRVSVVPTLVLVRGAKILGRLEGRVTGREITRPDRPPCRRVAGQDVGRARALGKLPLDADSPGRATACVRLGRGRGTAGRIPRANGPTAARSRGG